MPFSERARQVKPVQRKVTRSARAQSRRPVQRELSQGGLMPGLPAGVGVRPSPSLGAVSVRSPESEAVFSACDLKDCYYVLNQEFRHKSEQQNSFLFKI